MIAASGAPGLLAWTDRAGFGRLRRCWPLKAHKGMSVALFRSLARPILAWTLAWTLALGAVVASAQSLSLYTGDVPVPDQSDAARNEGLRAAFAQVLAKLSGDAAAPTREGLAKAVAEADHYVQQYSYRQDVVTDNGQPVIKLALVAQFDRNAVDRLLRDGGLKVLGASRPPVLTWLAIDDGAGPRLLADSAAPEPRQLLRTGQSRGLNLVLPALTEPGQAELGAETVWRNDLNSLSGALARYQANLMLVGQIRRVGEQWAARWTLVENGAGSTWDSADTALDTVLAAGPNGAADRLAGRYATPSLERKASSAVVWISGLSAATDYARLLEVLAHDELVREALPLQARGDGVLVRLNLNVTLKSWLGNLAPEGNLRVISAEPPLEGVEATLGFAR
jgi:hypothetical protein